MSLLPEGIVVLERGWLSANNILGFSGESASLIDSGYVTHAAQTVALVEHALAGRRLDALINTHSHSDHIGGNAALRARFGCEIVIPEGMAATISEWDEEALLLAPLGQQAARFAHQRTIRAGERFPFADLEWEAIAVPGHDADALAFHCPDRRLLISGDALWQNGFGVVFSELLGDPTGLATTRGTLDMIGRLPIDVVIPGHGAPFADVDSALRNAYRKLASFEADSAVLARHAMKVMLVFSLLERGQLRRADLTDFFDRMPFCRSVNDRFLGLPPDELASSLRLDLIRSGALREQDGILRPA